MRHRLHLAWLLFAGVLAAGAPKAAAGGAQQLQKPVLAQAETALEAGEADKVLKLLGSLPPLGESDQAQAHNLACRVRFTLEQWDAAVSECEKAVRLEGQNAEYHMWLGRALGEKADRANFLSAYSLAKRVRAEFEEAVRLSPRKPEALSDLGEFYFSAPGIVGGGAAKAEAIAAQLDKIEPSRAHELRGRIAVEHKDYGAAEREFKDAVHVGAHPAFHWVTLANFYRERERWAEMDSAIRSAIREAERDKRAGVALFDGASVLINAKREPELAAKMIEDYLAAYPKTEEAPVFVAHTRLARLKAQLGDSDAASREQAAALAIAHEYKPAQDLSLKESKH